MSLTSFLLPNLNGAFIFFLISIIIGVIVFIVGLNLLAVPKVGIMTMLTGVAIVMLGYLFWAGISMVEDFFNSGYANDVFIALGLILLVVMVLFREEIFEKKKKVKK